MSAEAKIRTALNRVIDPELRRGIVELGMVRDLEVSNEDVSFTLALTALAWPLKGKIVHEACEAVLGLGGYSNVSVDLIEMTAEEPPLLLRSRGDE